MTTRGQNLRSSTSGNQPAAGTRQPGEIWMTFPDIQLGYIDASRNAQKLIAVRFFSTLANYATGDFVIQAGKLYFAKAAITAGAFNATQWTQIAALTDIPALYVLPTASTSVLGGVKIDGVTITINSGVISSAGLVTVSATPPSPVQNGALWFDLVGGQLYAWVNDGTSSQWVVAVNQSLGGVYLPMTGGTLTGPLTLAGDPVNPLDAVTKQYADGHAINDNRIINADFRIDQRNNGASGTASGYTVDRWQYVGSQASKLTWQRATGPATIGFPYALWLTSSSAYTALAADSFFLNQTIEADMVSDLAWGTVSAQSATLSFWVLATVAGAYSGAIVNQPAPPTRCYPFTFSLLAGTWTKVVIPIPGDTAGTWVMSGNAGGVAVKFDLGSGSNFRGAAGAWVNGNLNGVTGAAALVATNGAALGVTGVKLEIGSVATPFNRQSLAKSMADCQRYWQQVQILWSGGTNNTSTYFATGTLPVAPRAAPTLTGVIGGATAFPAVVGTLGYGTQSVSESRVANATGVGSFITLVTASAEL